MSRFEFNSVLVSILLALATAELVTTWARVLRRPAVFGFSWRYLLLSLWILLSLVLHWYGLWAYRDVPIDSALRSFALLLPALTFALATHVLAPDTAAEGPDSLELHYEQVASRALPLCALAMLFSGLLDVLFAVDAPGIAYFVVSALSFVALVFTTRHEIHLAVLGVNALLSATVLVLARG